MTNTYKYQIKRRERLKNECVKKLGGKCIVCGYDKCNAALDFHHKDSKGKTKGIGTLIVKGYAEETIFLELEKCVLLCCRCHRELHGGLFTLDT